MFDPKVKHPMPTRDPKIRARDFLPVELGYDEETAVEEAKRCLNCKNKPCTGGCPVRIDIPAFIAKVAARDFDGAYEIINASSSLPAVCGRVCPQETQCESKCVRGIKGEPVAIGRLERFVADYHLNKPEKPVPKIEKNGVKVAIVGAGSAGLTCAGDLAKKGYEVTVFEALHKAGGVMTYGIPEFRLPKSIVSAEIENLSRLGVKIETNVVIGKTLTIEDLKEDGYKAIFIGSGAGLPKFLHIKGEELNGVFSANEFLTRINLMRAYEPDADTPIWRGNKVAVIGGGNVAMDAARSAMRLGAEKVYVVYRRSEEELPARREEVAHAKEEGVEFHLLTDPTEILDDGNYNVAGLRCVEMQLGEADASGRRRPFVKPDSEFVLEADTVIVSIGTAPNPLIKNATPELAVTDWGGIVVDEDLGTNLDGVYAGGDATSGAATVIMAMGAGKRAADSIDRYLNR
ncbi:MAG: NADPH-dependent glutamate synthase [Clostridia bacterium]|nr:NADPH-dependent glutamate synthase [Clostridia bacterium]